MSGERRLHTPNPEYPLEDVLDFALCDRTGIFNDQIFGGDRRYLQFKADSIRCYTLVPTDEVVTVRITFAGQEHSYDKRVEKPMLLAEYPSLVELYHGVENERQEHEDATRAEREELHEHLIEMLSSEPEQIEINEPEELKEFKAKTVTEGSIVEAAKRIVEFREQSGLDEDVIVCAPCKGNRQEKIDTNPSGSDHTASHGEGVQDSICMCCNDEGTISKYPTLTLVNSHTGQTLDLTFDIAKLLAEGAVSITRHVEETALDNGYIDHSTKTWITLSDWLSQQFAALGFDPQQTGVNANERFYEASRSLNFDIEASLDSWKRAADTPDGDPGEIFAVRKANQTVGVLPWDMRAEILTGEDIIIATQHQVAEYMSRAFSPNGDRKQHQELVLFNLMPIEESFTELKAAVEARGQSLGYSYSVYAGDCSYQLYLMNDKDEIVKVLENNPNSFRAAIENAKLKLFAA